MSGRRGGGARGAGRGGSGRGRGRPKGSTKPLQEKLCGNCWKQCEKELEKQQKAIQKAETELVEKGFIITGLQGEVTKLHHERRTKDELLKKLELQMGHESLDAESQIAELKELLEVERQKVRDLERTDHGEVVKELRGRIEEERRKGQELVEANQKSFQLIMTCRNMLSCMEPQTEVQSSTSAPQNLNQPDSNPCNIASWTSVSLPEDSSQPTTNVTSSPSHSVTPIITHVMSHSDLIIPKSDPHTRETMEVDISSDSDVSPSRLLSNLEAAAVAFSPSGKDPGQNSISVIQKQEIMSPTKNIPTTPKSFLSTPKNIPSTPKHIPSARKVLVPLSPSQQSSKSPLKRLGLPNLAVDLCEDDVGTSTFAQESDTSTSIVRDQSGQTTAVVRGQGLLSGVQKLEILSPVKNVEVATTDKGSRTPRSERLTISATGNAAEKSRMKSSDGRSAGEQECSRHPIMQFKQEIVIPVTNVQSSPAKSPNLTGKDTPSTGQRQAILSQVKSVQPSSMASNSQIDKDLHQKVPNLVAPEPTVDITKRQEAESSPTLKKNEKNSPQKTHHVPPGLSTDFVKGQQIERSPLARNLMTNSPQKAHRLMVQSRSPDATEDQQTTRSPPTLVAVQKSQTSGREKSSELTVDVNMDSKSGPPTLEAVVPNIDQNLVAEAEILSSVKERGPVDSETAVSKVAPNEISNAVIEVESEDAGRGNALENDKDGEDFFMDVEEVTALKEDLGESRKESGEELRVGRTGESQPEQTQGDSLIRAKVTFGTDNLEGSEEGFVLVDELTAGARKEKVSSTDSRESDTSEVRFELVDSSDLESLQDGELVEVMISEDGESCYLVQGGGVGNVEEGSDIAEDCHIVQPERGADLETDNVERGVSLGADRSVGATKIGETCRILHLARGVNLGVDDVEKQTTVGERCRNVQFEKGVRLAVVKESKTGQGESCRILHLKRGVNLATDNVEKQTTVGDDLLTDTAEKSSEVMDSELCVEKTVVGDMREGQDNASLEEVSNGAEVGDSEPQVKKTMTPAVQGDAPLVEVDRPEVGDVESVGGTEPGETEVEFLLEVCEWSEICDGESEVGQTTTGTVDKNVSSDKVCAVPRESYIEKTVTGASQENTSSAEAVRSEIEMGRKGGPTLMAESLNTVLGAQVKVTADKDLARSNKEDLKQRASVFDHLYSQCTGGRGSAPRKETEQVVELDSEIEMEVVQESNSSTTKDVTIASVEIEKPTNIFESFTKILQESSQRVLPSKVQKKSPVILRQSEEGTRVSQQTIMSSSGDSDFTIVKKRTVIPEPVKNWSWPPPLKAAVAVPTGEHDLSLIIANETPAMKSCMEIMKEEAKKVQEEAKADSSLYPSASTSTSDELMRTTIFKMNEDIQRTVYDFKHIRSVDSDQVSVIDVQGRPTEPTAYAEPSSMKSEPCRPQDSESSVSKEALATEEAKSQSEGEKSWWSYVKYPVADNLFQQETQKSASYVVAKSGLRTVALRRLKGPSDQPKKSPLHPNRALVVPMSKFVTKNSSATTSGEECKAKNALLIPLPKRVASQRLTKVFIGPTQFSTKDSILEFMGNHVSNSRAPSGPISATNLYPSAATRTGSGSQARPCPVASSTEENGQTLSTSSAGLALPAKEKGTILPTSPGIHYTNIWRSEPSSESGEQRTKPVEVREIPQLFEMSDETEDTQHIAGSALQRLEQDIERGEQETEPVDPGEIPSRELSSGMPKETEDQPGISGAESQLREKDLEIVEQGAEPGDLRKIQSREQASEVSKEPEDSLRGSESQLIEKEIRSGEQEIGPQDLREIGLREVSSEMSKELEDLQEHPGTGSQLVEKDMRSGEQQIEPTDLREIGSRELSSEMSKELEDLQQPPGTGSRLLEKVMESTEQGTESADLNTERYSMYSFMPNKELTKLGKRRSNSESTAAPTESNSESAAAPTELTPEKEAKETENGAKNKRAQGKTSEDLGTSPKRSKGKVGLAEDKELESASLVSKEVGTRSWNEERSDTVSKVLSPTKRGKGKTSSSPNTEEVELDKGKRLSPRRRPNMPREVVKDLNLELGGDGSSPHAQLKSASPSRSRRRKSQPMKSLKRLPLEDQVGPVEKLDKDVEIGKSPKRSRKVVASASPVASSSGTPPTPVRRGLVRSPKVSKDRTVVPSPFALATPPRRGLVRSPKIARETAKRSLPMPDPYEFTTTPEFPVTPAYIRKRQSWPKRTGAIGLSPGPRQETGMSDVELTFVEGAVDIGEPREEESSTSDDKRKLNISRPESAIASTSTSVGNQEVDISQYFEEESFEKFPDNLQQCLRNMKSNYETMQQFGFEVKKPIFMKNPIRKKRKVLESVSESESEIEDSPQKIPVTRPECTFCSPRKPPVVYRDESDLAMHIFEKHHDVDPEQVMSVVSGLKKSAEEIKSLSVKKRPKLKTEEPEVEIKKETHSCEQCGKCFRTKNSLRIHTNRHKEKKIPCKYCDKRFHYLHDMLRHARIHTKEKPHKCAECGMSFSQTSQLTVHMRCHSGEKPFSCIICGKSFTQQSHLRTHLASHTKEKRFFCEECGKGFYLREKYNNHLDMHAGIKRFECGTCGKKFSHISNVRKHERIHQNLRPHVCDECEKRFITTSDLKAHKRTHSGEKPFFCDQCEKSFKTLGNLRKHRLIHGTTGNFKCDVCGAGYLRQANYMKHMESHVEGSLLQPVRAVTSGDKTTQE